MPLESCRLVLGEDCFTELGDNIRDKFERFPYTGETWNLVYATVYQLAHCDCRGSLEGWMRS